MTCKFCGMTIVRVGDAYFTGEMMNGFYTVCKVKGGAWRDHEPVVVISYVEDLVEVFYS